MAVELKTESAIAVHMDAVPLVDEMTCVVRSTSDLPTELSTAESSDQDSCVGYWTDSTSDQGESPQQSPAEGTPPSDWSGVGRRLSRVFQNFDSDEDDDVEDFAEPSSLPSFRLPPGLTVEPLDTAISYSSDDTTEDEVPFAFRLSEAFRNFDPDEDADVESDMEDVAPCYMEQDISDHDAPDFGPPPGLTREVVALSEVDEANLRRILTSMYYSGGKDETPAWRDMCLHLASAVAEVKSDDPDM